MVPRQTYRESAVTPQRKSRTWRIAREWVVLLGLLFSCRSAVADWYDVPSGSMEPTILPGDRIVANKLAYGLRIPFTFEWAARWTEPAPGEVVIVHSPRDGVRLVKRLIAGPGDTVEMQNNRLVINGVELGYAPWPSSTPSSTQPKHTLANESLGGRSHAVMETPALPATRSFGPVKVPPGRYFVMGDNRDQSGDSRLFGFVDRDKIVGRSSVVAISFDPERYYKPRWERFFTALR